MPTIIDAKEWIFDQLVTAKTNSEITIGGEVYIDKKPTTGKEDIVVGALLMNSDFWQNAVLNVNCYVPDIEIRTDGKVVMMPDRTRLKVIAQDVYAVLKDQTSDQTYRSYVEFTTQLEEIDEQSHFMNFRIQMYAVNY